MSRNPEGYNPEASSERSWIKRLLDKVGAKEAALFLALTAGLGSESAEAQEVPKPEPNKETASFIKEQREMTVLGYKAMIREAEFRGVNKKGDTTILSPDGKKSMVVHHNERGELTGATLFSDPEGTASYSDTDANGGVDKIILDNGRSIHTITVHDGEPIIISTDKLSDSTVTRTGAEAQMLAHAADSILARGVSDILDFKNPDTSKPTKPTDKNKKW